MPGGAGTPTLGRATPPYLRRKTIDGANATRPDRSRHGRGPHPPRRVHPRPSPSSAPPRPLHIGTETQPDHPPRSSLDPPAGTHAALLEPETGRFRTSYRRGAHRPAPEGPRPVRRRRAPDRADPARQLPPDDHHHRCPPACGCRGRRARSAAVPGPEAPLLDLIHAVTDVVVEGGTWDGDKAHPLVDLGMEARHPGRQLPARSRSTRSIAINGVGDGIYVGSAQTPCRDVIVAFGEVREERPQRDVDHLGHRLELHRLHLHRERRPVTAVPAAASSRTTPSAPIETSSSPGAPSPATSRVASSS